MNYYNITSEETIKRLNSNLDGLSSKEANDRLLKYGKNILPKKKNDSVLTILFRQIKDPIVLLLIVTVIFSFVINEVIDALAIIFIIIVDLIMGTYQEWKASKNALELGNLIKVNTKVIRDSKEILVDSEDLVIGDIVLLESGDKVSADLRIIESQNLTIDESILTGESLSVQKSNVVLNDNTALADRKNMIYAGTNVLTGRSKAIVIATKDDTEIGKIASSLSDVKTVKSPLTIRMEKFSKQISILIVIIAIIITILLLQKGISGSEIFLSVIALSVSAMPEGLPLALTMALTIASNRMSKKNVIVKRLNSVESLGSCTVIASDKTGTLTVNEQTAKKILLPDNSSYDITGNGYNINGKVVSDYDISKALKIAKLGVINNEATIKFENNSLQTFGDSIDIAFLVLGKKLGINDDFKIIKRIPYESENKYSAIFYEEDGDIYCTVKGSIEKVIDFSKTMDNKKINKEILEAQNDSLAKEGYRVIALASGKVPKKDKYTEDDIKNLDFTGLVAFIDPVREEVKDSILKCHNAGIKVLMITGDHPLTAYSIAKDLNIIDNYDKVATGSEVDEYFDKGELEFDKFVKSKTVFSRVTPTNKLEIVKSLSRQKEFVAVTGDGVNDAPALKAASIGIAMGSGTDVAKETASMIILDDNFKSIVAGIEEGRTAYNNIRKVSYMLLSCGMAEVLFFILSIIFNLPMPLVAIQLLWLNIVTDGLQDFALSFEKTEDNTMTLSPRRTDESIFNRELFSEVFISGLTIGLIIFGIWYYLLNKVNMDINLARGYIMALMVFMQNIHVLNCRSEKTSAFKIPLGSNKLIFIAIASSIILQILVMEVPILSSFLKTSSVPILDLIKLFLISLIILFVMELYKLIKSKINN